MADAVVVEFDQAVHSLDALNAAAYRLIGTASCQVETRGNQFVCRLTPSAAVDASDIRLRFIDLVTDEQLRERLAERTEPVRNLILSLAFGSLASHPTDKS